MNNSKVVLISDTGYSNKHEDHLIPNLGQVFELFCVVGKQCEFLEEVIEFYKAFSAKITSGVEVVRI